MRLSDRSKSRMKSRLARPVPKDLKGPGLKASISAPIPMMYPDGEELTIIRNAIPIQQTHQSPEDINAKIQAMLAAHKQLKEGNQEPSTPTSKASRIVSKVASVLSLSNRKDRHKETGATPGKSPAEQYLQRINASDDVQRFKAQGTAGNASMRIPRKPVPNSASTILTARNTACNYNAEALRKLTSAISEDQRPSSSQHSLESLDPFSSESGFEDDLEYGILNLTPDGTSTPSAGRDLRHITDNRGSPLPRKQSQYQTPDQDQDQYYDQSQDQIQIQTRATGHDQDHDQNHDQNQILHSQECENPSISAETDFFMSDTSSESNGASDTPGVPPGKIRSKKHPSPSHGWWKDVQDLQDALLKVSNASHRLRPAGSLDELRYGSDGPHWLTSHFPEHMQLPRPVRQSWRTFDDMRPDDEGADEIDELS